ncbi:uncharacterized protein TRIVIDRAFT_198220 [Trichoderma virens Gv29-8]|uniref:Uncharacterized protein n=1 Tax=Hypocrea virens (strain Gv29-8 / FGSC 10586) TaxID=413071 RepID=G9MIB5_HYPVG|nr:uncharacterized protein TRIVIDRAFT_198220 [Trichoderma virens Gv29-8]EHK25232.1 hypothetical protein TRIVIDRAFT_198220 [Trichoderma virens Gv29-8]
MYHTGDEYGEDKHADEDAITPPILKQIFKSLLPTFDKVIVLNALYGILLTKRLPQILQVRLAHDGTVQKSTTMSAITRYDISNLGLGPDDEDYSDGVACIEAYWAYALDMTPETRDKYLGLLRNKKWTHTVSSRKQPSQHRLYKSSVGKTIPGFLVIRALYKKVPEEFKNRIRERGHVIPDQDRTKEYLELFPDTTPAPVFDFETPEARNYAAQWPSLKVTPSIYRQKPVQQAPQATLVSQAAQTIAQATPAQRVPRYRLPTPTVTLSTTIHQRPRNPVRRIILRELQPGEEANRRQIGDVVCNVAGSNATVAWSATREMTPIPAINMADDVTVSSTVAQVAATASVQPVMRLSAGETTLGQQKSMLPSGQQQAEQRVRSEPTRPLIESQLSRLMRNHPLLSLVAPTSEQQQAELQPMPLLDRTAEISLHNVMDARWEATTAWMRAASEEFVWIRSQLERQNQG